MDQKPNSKNQLNRVLHQALEPEYRRAKVYVGSLSPEQKSDVKADWEAYVKQMRAHDQVLLKVFDEGAQSTDAEDAGHHAPEHDNESQTTSALRSAFGTPAHVNGVELKRTTSSRKEGLIHISDAHHSSTEERKSSGGMSTSMITEKWCETMLNAKYRKGD